MQFTGRELHLYITISTNKKREKGKFLPQNYVFAASKMIISEIY